MAVTTHKPSKRSSQPSHSHGRRHHHGHKSVQRKVFWGAALLSLLATVFSTFRRSATVMNMNSLRILETSFSASTFNNNHQNSPLPFYQPAPVEAFIMNHTVQLGYNVKPPYQYVETCKIWQDPSVSPYYHAQLLQYFGELRDYYERLNKFHLPSLVKDVRYDPNPNTNDEEGGDVCDLLELDPQGLPGIFRSQQLSRTQNNEYIEPLTTPMRHPIMCIDPDVPNNMAKLPDLMQIRYLVHDWAAICRNLKPRSRTVFIDMGASLQFHVSGPSPTLVLLEQFRRFGIVFDHIYAYELLEHDPKMVQEMIPKHFRPAFHWINVGVESDPNSPHNPWNLILDNFHEDDLIVVKLDIDTPAVERPLAHQLYRDPRLAKLVDHFYFEHHVNSLEMAYHWGATDESVEDSFQLFHGLRQKGVASHFWV